MAPEPVTSVAGRPLINKSAASTPLTGSLKRVVIWYRRDTSPGGGVTLARTGALETSTVTFTTAEVARALRLSVATARSAYDPTGTELQEKLKGVVVSSPSFVLPAKNSTRLIVPSGSAALAASRMS